MRNMKLKRGTEYCPCCGVQPHWANYNNLKEKRFDKRKARREQKLIEWQAVATYYEEQEVAAEELLKLWSDISDDNQNAYEECWEDFLWEELVDKLDIENDVQDDNWMFEYDDPFYYDPYKNL